MMDSNDPTPRLRWPRYVVRPILCIHPRTSDQYRAWSPGGRTPEKKHPTATTSRDLPSRWALASHSEGPPAGGLFHPNSPRYMDLSPFWTISGLLLVSSIINNTDTQNTTSINSDTLVIGSDVICDDLCVLGFGLGVVVAAAVSALLLALWHSKAGGDIRDRLIRA